MTTGVRLGLSSPGIRERPVLVVKQRASRLLPKTQSLSLAPSAFAEAEPYLRRRFQVHRVQSAPRQRLAWCRDNRLPSRGDGSVRPVLGVWDRFLFDPVAEVRSKPWHHALGVSVRDGHTRPGEPNLRKHCVVPRRKEFRARRKASDDLLHLITL